MKEFLAIENEIQSTGTAVITWGDKYLLSI